METIYCRFYDNIHLKKFNSHNNTNRTYQQLLKVAHGLKYNYTSEAFIILHTIKFYSAEEIGDMFKVNKNTIINHLKQMYCYTKFEFRYQSEKYIIATNLGYKSIYDCIVGEYKKTKSAAKTAKIMETTPPVIFRFLKRHNIKINSPGGANNYKKPNTKHKFEKEYNEIITSKSQVPLFKNSC